MLKRIVAERSYLRSGDVARLTGVSPDTLRHYERRKLIAVPRRSPGNYRLYPPETVDRVRLIRRALAVGFSLSELARILKVRDEGGAPCRQAKRLLEEKLSQVEQQITDLGAMRDHLRIVLKDWDQRLSAMRQEPSLIANRITTTSTIAAIMRWASRTKRPRIIFV